MVTFSTLSIESLTGLICKEHEFFLFQVIILILLPNLEDTLFKLLIGQFLKPDKLSALPSFIQKNNQQK